MYSPLRNRFPGSDWIINANGTHANCAATKAAAANTIHVILGCAVSCYCDVAGAGDFVDFFIKDDLTVVWYIGLGHNGTVGDADNHMSYFYEGIPMSVNKALSISTGSAGGNTIVAVNLWGYSVSEAIL